MSLQEELLAVATKEMSDAIDWEIVSSMLCEMGWVRVQLPLYTDNYHAIDVREWIRESCKGKTDSRGATWIFEDPADATMFSLRWL
jgi:hypothetical protein